MSWLNVYERQAKALHEMAQKFASMGRETQARKHKDMAEVYESLAERERKRLEEKAEPR